MSFRGRLFIFFTIIVIVPMAAVAVVLFKITSDSETGKSDARIAQGLTTALAIYQADVDPADGALTPAGDYVRSVKRLTGLDAQVLSSGTRLATSGPANGRNRFQRVQAAPLP